MQIKMKELVTLSGESKSTILYYVKEGLLPEPSKPKPNVHLYDKSCVQILRFIKYLQNSFSYSISEIKNIFKNNNFDFDDSFEMIVRSLELISGGRDGKWYDEQEFLEIVGMDDMVLRDYQKRGYLFARANGFGAKEIEVARILESARAFELDFALIDSYVSDAKAIAVTENGVGAKLLSDDSDTHNARYEILFDLILKLKPYIYNMHTAQAHHNNISKDNR